MDRQRRVFLRAAEYAVVLGTHRPQESLSTLPGVHQALVRIQRKCLATDEDRDRLAFQMAMAEEFGLR
jgi:hypothetical protein